MSAVNSIYKISNYDGSTAYERNDIVQQPVLSSSPAQTPGVPKEIRYFYALKAVPAGNQPPAANSNAASNQFWGGLARSSSGVMKPPFLWKPSYNGSVSHAPRVNIISFGNGYEQRVQDGIYNGLISFSATFEMRTEKEARAIIQFLRARRGAQSFSMAHLPPIYSDPANFKKLFICSNFDSTFTFFDNYTVKATFIEKNN